MLLFCFSECNKCCFSVSVDVINVGFSFKKNNNNPLLETKFDKPYLRLAQLISRSNANSNWIKFKSQRKGKVLERHKAAGPPVQPCMKINKAKHSSTWVLSYQKLKIMTNDSSIRNANHVRGKTKPILLKKLLNFFHYWRNYSISFITEEILNISF